MEQGAVFVSGIINWEKIEAHRAAYCSDMLAQGQFPDWNEEFPRFISDKANYTDAMIILGCTPYSAVPVSALELSEEAWRKLSRTIRLTHECTHFICRTKYPEKVSPIWDEILADAAGGFAAFGCFRPDLVALFLGVKEGHYTGGRLQNYLENPQDKEEAELWAGRVEKTLERMASYLAAQTEEPASWEDFVLQMEERMEELSCCGSGQDPEAPHDPN